MTKIAIFSPFREGYVDVLDVPQTVKPNVGVLLLTNYLGRVPQGIPNGRYTVDDLLDRMNLMEIEDEQKLYEKF